MVHMELVEPRVLEKTRVKLVFLSRVVGSCPKHSLSYFYDIRKFNLRKYINGFEFHISLNNMLLDIV